MDALPGAPTVEAHRAVFAATDDPRWHASIEIAPDWTCSAAAAKPALSLVGRDVPALEDLPLLGVVRRGGVRWLDVRGGPLMRNVDEAAFAEHHLRELGLERVDVDAPPDLPIAAGRDASGALAFATARTAPGRVVLSTAWAPSDAAADRLAELVGSVASLRLEGAGEGARAEPLRGYDFGRPAGLVAQAPAGYLPSALLGEPDRGLQLELEDRADALRGALTIAAFSRAIFDGPEAVLAAYRKTLERRGYGCSLVLGEPESLDRGRRVLRDVRRASATAAQRHVDVRVAIGSLEGAWVLLGAVGPSSVLSPAGHLVHRCAHELTIDGIRSERFPLGRPGDASTAVPLLPSP